MASKVIRKLAGWAFAMALVASAAPLMAQTGGVVGTAKGTDGKKLPGYTVQIERQGMKGTYKVKTDKKGGFVYIGLPVGDYKLTLEDPSGHALTYTQQHVDMGDPTEVDFDLAKDKGAKQVLQALQSQKQFGALNDLYNKATALYNQQKFVEAAATYAQAVPLATGKNAEVIQIKEAASYDGAQQYDKAVQVLQQALQTDPKSNNLHIALGNVYADMGNIEAAKKELSAAGQTADIKILEEREKVAKTNQKFANLKQTFTAADGLYNQGQYAQAAATFEKAAPTATGKNLPIVLGRAADSYDKAKMYPQAAANYEKAIQAEPTNASFYNNLGNVYGHLGKTDQAIQQYEKAAQVDPPNAANYYFNEGALMENSGKFEQAAAAFKKATQANPKAANAYYLEAQALMGEAKIGPDGKVEPVPGTIEALQQYLQIAPTGQYASAAQQMLQTLSGKVQTKYRKR